MGVYLLLACFCCLCSASARNIVNSSSSNDEQKKLGYDFNYVLKELFKEMNSTMAHVIARKTVSEGKANGQGNVNSSKLLAQRMKEIFMSDEAFRNTSNKKNETLMTGAVGVFRNIFNKMAKGINKLYGSTKDNDYERYIEAVTSIKRVNSIQPILDRLKKFDIAGKRKGIYYEEGSGNEIEKKSINGILPRTLSKMINSVEHVQGKAAVFVDDTEGSADGSAQDDSSESGSGSNEIETNNVLPKDVKVTQGKVHKQLINFVARGGKQV